MNFTDTNTYITTEYRKFAKKQFLDPSQFNEFLNYFDSQEKFTRLATIGSGIFCGFTPLAYFNSRGLTALSLSQGLGATSNGTLLYLYNKINEASGSDGIAKVNFDLDKKIFTHFRIYDDYRVEPKYAPFYYGNNFEDVDLSEHFTYNSPSSIPLYELATNEEALANSNDNNKFKPLNNLNIKEELFIILYNETYDKIEKPCVGVNCDQPAATHIQNLKVLLTNKAGIELLAEKDVAFLRNDTPRLLTNLRDVNIKRPILNNQIASASILTMLYQSGTLDATLLRDLEYNYNSIAQFFKMESSVVNLRNLIFPLFEGDNFKFQYGYSFIKDLIANFNEIRALFSKFTASCDLTENTFKSHLMLGSLQNPTDLYRHGFYGSPALHKENIEEQIKFLISRGNQMVQRFEIPTSNEIRVTGSMYHAALGEKAIPWYYKFEAAKDSFVKNWSYKLFAQKQEALNASYAFTNLTLGEEAAPRSGDLERWDKKDFFRIEGIQGLPYEEAKNKLEELKATHQLSFDVIILSLTRLKSTEDPTKTFFCDFVTENPGLSHVGGVPEGGTFAIVYKSEFEPEVIADLGTPASCCLPKIPTILEISVDQICQFDTPIPLEVSPKDGILTANVLNGLEAGITGNEETGYFLDPSKVSEELLDTDIKFKINNKPVGATLKVLAAPKVEEIKVVEAYFSESDADIANITFKVDYAVGVTGKDYVFEWDLYGDGNFVKKQPNTKGEVAFEYKILGETAEIKAKVKVKGINGCPLFVEVNEFFNRVPSIEGNTISLDISSTLQPLLYTEVVKNYVDPDMDAIASLQLYSKNAKLDLIVNSKEAILNTPYVAAPEPQFEAKYISNIANPLYLPKNVKNSSGECVAEIIEIDKTAYEEAIIEDLVDPANNYNLLTIDNEDVSDRKAIFQKIVSNTTGGTGRELPNDAIIYVHVDTSSMLRKDQDRIKEVALDWWREFQIDRPDFNGNFLINTVSNIDIGNNHVPDRSGTAKNSIIGFDFFKGNFPVEEWVENPHEAILRHSWSQGENNFADETAFYDYVEKEKLSVVVLSFVDEAVAEYHASVPSLSGPHSYPRERFRTAYDKFVTDLFPKLNYFKGVLYPITKVNTNYGNDFLVHALASLHPEDLTKSIIDDLLGIRKIEKYGTEYPTNSNILASYFYNNLAIDNEAGIPINNPYAKDYSELSKKGWEGRFDKFSPASVVLGSQDFKDEFNDILTTVTNSSIKEIPINNLGTVISTDFVLNVTDDNTLGAEESNRALIKIDFSIPCEADVPVLNGTTLINDVALTPRILISEGFPVDEAFVDESIEDGFIGLDEAEYSYALTYADFEILEASVTKIKIENVTFLNTKLDFKINNLTIENNVPIIVETSALNKNELNLIVKNIDDISLFSDGENLVEFSYRVAKDGQVNFSEAINVTILNMITFFDDRFFQT